MNVWLNPWFCDRKPLSQPTPSNAPKLPEVVVWVALSRFVQATVSPVLIARSCSTKLMISDWTVAGAGVAVGAGTVADAAGTDVAVGTGVAVAVGTGVEVGTTIGTGTGVSVAVGLGVRVLVGVSVDVGWAVGLGNGASVAAAVGDGEGVCDDAGERVGVGVFGGTGDGICVGEGVAAGTDVSVATGVGVAGAAGATVGEAGCEVSVGFGVVPLCPHAAATARPANKAPAHRLGFSTRLRIWPARLPEYTTTNRPKQLHHTDLAARATSTMLLSYRLPRTRFHPAPEHLRRGGHVRFDVL